MEDENKLSEELAEETAEEIAEEVTEEIAEEAAPETVEEAEEAAEETAEDIVPEIQALDDPHDDEEDEDIIEDEDENPFAPAHKKTKKTKKKTQLSKGCSIVLFIFLAIMFIVLCFVGWGAYQMVQLNKCNVTLTEVADYLDAMNSASELEAKYYAGEPADTADDSDTTESTAVSASDVVSAFDSAISPMNAKVDDEGNVPEYIVKNFIAPAVCSEAAVLYDDSGYSDAIADIAQYLSADQYKYLKCKTCKSIVKTAKSVTAAAEDALDKVLTADESTTGTAIAANYSFIDDAASESFANAVDYLLTAYQKDTAAESLADSISAFTDYEQAVTTLGELGVANEEFANKLASVLYKNNCVYNALYIRKTYISEDSSVEKTDAYTEIEERTALIAETYSSFYKEAVEAKEAGRKGADIYTDEKFTDAENKYLALITDLIIEGLEAKEEKNLTLSADKFSGANAAAYMLGVSDASLIYNWLDILLTTGSIQYLQNYSEQLVTDEVKAAFSEEEKAGYDKIVAVLSALDTASNTFGSYYQNYYYYGSLDYESCVADLDALITDDADKYLVTFVNYCKYVAGYYSGNSADCASFVKAMEESTPELITFYGYYAIQDSLNDSDTAGAAEMADRLLEINKADDYAIAIKAQVARMNKNYEEAVEIAQTGIELLGDEAGNCSKEIGIDLMLQGDWAKAYKYIISYYNSYGTQSIDAMDLVTILNYLYDGEDEDIKSELADTAASIEETLAYYTAQGYTAGHYDDTNDILAGKTTFEKVMTTGAGVLTNSETSTEE